MLWACYREFDWIEMSVLHGLTWLAERRGQIGWPGNRSECLWNVLILLESRTASEATES